MNHDTTPTAPFCNFRMTESGLRYRSMQEMIEELLLRGGGWPRTLRSRRAASDAGIRTNIDGKVLVVPEGNGVRRVRNGYELCDWIDHVIGEVLWKTRNPPPSGEFLQSPVTKAEFFHSVLDSGACKDFGL